MAITAHAFAQKLLNGPDFELFVLDSVGPCEVDSSPQVYEITQDDEHNCGSCDGRVGDQVIAVYL